MIEENEFVLLLCELWIALLYLLIMPQPNPQTRHWQ